MAQFGSNRFQAPYNELDSSINRADYMINHFVPEIRSLIYSPFLKSSDLQQPQKVKAALGLLKMSSRFWRRQRLNLLLATTAFDLEGYSRGVAKQLKTALATLVTSCLHYFRPSVVSPPK